MLLGVPITTWAQGSAEANDARTYGTASSVIHMVQAYNLCTSDRDSDSEGPHQRLDGHEQPR